MTDEKMVRLRAHGNNIARYRRLLQTKLTDVERRYIESRLAEEEKALTSIGPFTMSARKSHERFENTPSR